VLDDKASRGVSEHGKVACPREVLKLDEPVGRLILEFSGVKYEVSNVLDAIGIDRSGENDTSEDQEEIFVCFLSGRIAEALFGIGNSIPGPSDDNPGSR